jgi:glycosyltransferase involved in cell wall biosynthesis
MIEGTDAGSEVPGFSIVLCTYNGASRLEKTIKHLAGLNIPAGHKTELILVDNASTDNTVAFAQKIWFELETPFPLKIVTEKRQGKGFAIETGYDAASYTYILTVDDDNWLDAGYLNIATRLFQQHPDAGILQGRNVAAFEVAPPPWFEELEPFFVIGSPVPQTGYFPRNHFGVWGAGMVILNKDWKEIRSNGFGFLTSKSSGKAAGEDHETAIALLMLGRKIYYSDELVYTHFMPSGRITWENLKKGFNVWAFLQYYYLLYGLAIESHEKKQTVTPSLVYKKGIRHFISALNKYSLKQHAAYWVRPKQEYYQVRLYRDLCFYKWLMKLKRNTDTDVQFLQKWMSPLLENNPEAFKMPQLN